MKDQYKRFWSKVQKMGPEECWPWIGMTTPSGYGAYHYGGRTMNAHRYSFFLHNGYWPDSTDHLCRNKICVNPSHLESVTTGENVRRKPRLQVCKRGHELSPENYYVWHGKDGYTRRVCKICRAITKREFYVRSRLI